MNVPPLTLRIDKGAPLTAEEGDGNLKILRDAINGLAALLGLVVAPDGTLKPGVVSTTSLANRSITQGKLDWLANFFAVATGTDSYSITFTPDTPAFGYGDGATGSFLCLVKFTNANTGPSTLEVNLSGAKAIKKFVSEELEPGDIGAGAICLLAFDGTNFQIITIIKDTFGIQSGIESDGGVGNGAALGVSSTDIGEFEITKPSGKKWSWVKAVFSTSIVEGAGNGIDDILVKLNGDAVGWFDIGGGLAWVVENNDDSIQIVFISEGAPTGHEEDNTLTINFFAKQNAGQADLPAFRKMYVVGWWQ